MRTRNSRGEISADTEFADLFARRGHPALSPGFLTRRRFCGTPRDSPTGRPPPRSAAGPTGSTA